MTHPEPDTHPFAHYLLSKRTVDDRALHPRLWQTFLTHLDDLAPEPSRLAPTASAPIHILELGSGIGTMFERIMLALRPCSLLYTAVDSDPDILAVAAQRLSRWAETRTYTRCESPGTSTPTQTSLDFVHPQGHTLSLRLICADAQTDDPGMEDQILSATNPSVDAVVAHAFLDLVECRPLLFRLAPLLTAAARLYLTINFDGLTVFEPPVDPILDRLIESLYHATMDTRIVDGRPAGHSHTGRRLYHDLRAAGYDILDIGSSDWVVFPQLNGYTNQDRQFLHHILDFVQGALTGHPDLNPDAFAEWLSVRRQQIEDADLLYLAHQLDYLARPIPPHASS